MRCHANCMFARLARKVIHRMSRGYLQGLPQSGSGLWITPESDGGTRVYGELGAPNPWDEARLSSANRSM